MTANSMRLRSFVRPILGALLTFALVWEDPEQMFQDQARSERMRKVIRPTR